MTYLEFVSDCFKRRSLIKPTEMEGTIKHYQSREDRDDYLAFVERLTQEANERSEEEWERIEAQTELRQDEYLDQLDRTKNMNY